MGPPSACGISPRKGGEKESAWRVGWLIERQCEHVLGVGSGDGVEQRYDDDPLGVAVGFIVEVA